MRKIMQRVSRWFAGVRRKPRRKPKNPSSWRHRHKVMVGTHSSIRKLARAFRRGFANEDRVFIIEQAAERAAERAPIYLNSCQAKRQYKAAQSSGLSG